MPHTNRPPNKEPLQNHHHLKIREILKDLTQLPLGIFSNRESNYYIVREGTEGMIGIIPEKWHFFMYTLRIYVPSRPRERTVEIL